MSITMIAFEAHLQLRISLDNILYQGSFCREAMSQEHPACMVL